MTVTRTRPGPPTELLRAALAGVAADPAQVSVLSSQELASAAGRRRVVEHLVGGLDPTGPVRLIAKTFDERRRAELLCQHLRVLGRGPFAVGPYRVPELVAFLPAAHLVLYRASTGVPLGQLDGPALLDGARDAARWLATLHASRVELPRRFDEAREQLSTHAWAAVIGRHHPEVRQPAQRLAAAWAAGGPTPPLTAQVPLHKDFHAGHVLLDSQVCVIDLDEARQGDPAFDLAHFCTNLEGPRGLQGPGEPRAARRVFLEEYTRCTGWADDGSLARYRAYTWLKIAKQLALGSGPYRARRSRDGRAVDDAVARGLACLAR